jgi:hypothetical protein
LFRVFRYNQPAPALENMAAFDSDAAFYGVAKCISAPKSAIIDRGVIAGQTPPTAHHDRSFLIRWRH